MSTVLQLRILLPAPDKQMITLEGSIPNTIYLEQASQLAFDIERTLNEHLPRIRFHAAINVVSQIEKDEVK